MRSPDISDITELYVGAPIAYASERLVLKTLLQSIETRGLQSVVLANVNLSDRQLDFVVVNDKLVLLIEVKGFRHPVRGGKNGRWHVQTGADIWKPTKNAYTQTLGASLALRDAMRRFCGTEVAYVSAALVFAPSIPEGSSLPHGDFKVSVGDVSLLGDLSTFANRNSWPLAMWRRFARKIGLERVMTFDAAIDEKVASAESTLKEYTDAFFQTYSQSSSDLVPFMCNDGKSEISSREIVDSGFAHPGLIIVGPSGCGKSLLAQSIALRAIEAKEIPLFVEVKYFDGDFGRIIEQEVSLLGIQPAREFLAACRTLERPLLLIVDGFNECAKSERKYLMRCISAISRRYEATLVITSQKVFHPLGELGLPEIKVAAPDLDVKRAIAGLTEECSSSTAINMLLEGARTGLEARLIGDVGRSVPAGASRFAIFDAYARKCLEDKAPDGISALALLGGSLSERVAFSISVREFDRLMESSNFSALMSELLFRTRLLERYSDRVSFGHEMYLNAFAAESVVRAAAGDLSAIVTALTKPIHKSRKVFIVGAIDDDLAMKNILAIIEDPDIVTSCMEGECGDFARQWVEGLYKSILERVDEEAKSVLFHIEAAGWANIAPRADTLTAWSAADQAFLDALPRLLLQGMFLDEVFTAVGAMDESLERAYKDLGDDARIQGVAIRSDLFGAAFVHQGLVSSAITKICALAHSGIGFFQGHANQELLNDRLDSLMGEELSPGQVYLWLRLARQVHHPDIIADILPSFIRKYWLTAPYHLRLDLLDAGYWCGRCSESRRRKIIDALEALPRIKNIMLSSTLIDALVSLGALQECEEAHDESVKHEMDIYFANPDEAESCSAAASHYFAQFDHPYSSAYSRVISELPEEHRHQFLVMAVRGTDEITMFLSSLIIELGEIGVPANGELIQRWTAVPPHDYFTPQDAIGVFITSHLVLGRLGVPLESLQTNDDSIAAKAWAACGELIYWTNRCDLDWPQRIRECIPAWEVLAGTGSGFSLDPIRQFESPYLPEDYSRLPGCEPVRRSIIESFPDEIARLSRHALANPEIQGSYFRWTKIEEILRFAVSVLGEAGRSTDIPTLKSLVDNSHLGEGAIAAVRKLEQRVSDPI